MELIIIVFS